MKALLYKRKHTFAPWLLKWEVNGLKYVDTVRIKSEAIKYAQAIGATVETINGIGAQGGGKTARKEGNMNTLREYNVMREPWLPLEEQKKADLCILGRQDCKAPYPAKRKQELYNFYCKNLKGANFAWLPATDICMAAREKVCA